MDRVSCERHIVIANDWFQENPDGVFYIEPLVQGSCIISHDKHNFRPLRVSINYHTDDTVQSTATSAKIRGYLHGENEQDLDDYILTVNVVHDLAFKAIYAEGTTARGIKIFG